MGFEISKTGDFIYIINEYSSTVAVLKKGSEKYQEIQNVSTLETTFKGDNFCADIHLSNDGNYLYGSNRGENSRKKSRKPVYINSEVGQVQCNLRVIHSSSASNVPPE